MQFPSYNFGEDTTAVSDWSVVVDGVMGGKSQGSLKSTTDSIIFSGSISLENNGGFASIRTNERAFDLSGFRQVTIRYKSIGQDFSFYLNRYRKYFEPKFRTDLPITNNEWNVITVSLQHFKITRLGKLQDGEVTRDDLSHILRLGFITNTKAATDFEIEVDKIVFE